MKASHGAVAILVLSGLIHSAIAREGGNWAATPKNVRDWLATLMQPDNPSVSCCGEADAYWADRYEVDGDEYVAMITDDRGEIYDDKVGRATRAVGTKIPVPNSKLKWDDGNPTGHGVVFLSTRGKVICYLPPSGV
jgi:hypothetical protein